MVFHLLAPVKHIVGYRMVGLCRLGAAQIQHIILFLAEIYSPNDTRPCMQLQKSKFKKKKIDAYQYVTHLWPAICKTSFPDL